MSSPFRTPGTTEQVPPRVRCLYCGGLQSAYGNACATCGVEMGQVFCAACAAWRVAGEPLCAGCGGELPGPAPQGEPSCPRCGGALPLVPLDGAALRVRSCGRCFGSFLAIHDWSELLDRAARGQREALGRFVPAPPGRELPRQALLAEVKCPECHAPMERISFAAQSPTVVDVCKMHGLWLDAGEAPAVVAWVRAREENGGRVPVREDAALDPEVQRAFERGRRIALEEQAFHRSLDRLERSAQRPQSNGRAGMLAAELAIRLLLGG